MARPTPSTVKQLFAVSGNQCAFPGCTAPLVTNGVVTAEICHIEAQNSMGPRYNPKQSDKERHGFDNLILMCGDHHKVIDTDAEKYTVEKLVEMKAKHETQHAGDAEPSDDVVRQSLVKLEIHRDVSGQVAVVGRDKIEGDQVLGNKMVTNISLDFWKAVKAVGAYLVSYFRVFVGVIIAPRDTFESLLNLQVPRETFLEKVGVSIRPVIFAAINIALGVIVASSLSVKGAPESFGLPLFGTIVSQLFLWIIYSVFIHLVLARVFKGSGTVGQTMAGVLYVLGTLQPVMLFFIYVTSTLFPDVLTYDLITRYASSYDTTTYTEEQLNFFGVSLIALYWLVSFSLTFAYLYFPLHIAHRLPLRKILFSYLAGMVLLGAFACISCVVVALIGTTIR
jgi:hypothetical protein